MKVQRMTMKLEKGQDLRLTPKTDKVEEIIVFLEANEEITVENRGYVVLRSERNIKLVVDGPGHADAWRFGAGKGACIRAGAGSGNALRGGTGYGNALRMGSGSGKATRTPEGPGHQGTSWSMDNVPLK